MSKFPDYVISCDYGQNECLEKALYIKNKLVRAAVFYANIYTSMKPTLMGWRGLSN